MNELNLSTYFPSPIYSGYIPEWVEPLNKASDQYITFAANKNKEFIKERQEFLGKKIGDFGITHHSVTLLPDLNFREFKKYTLDQSIKVLDEMGYDLRNYRL